MNILDMQLFQSSKMDKPVLEELVQKEDEKVFAKKGNDNYNEAMDYNGDGVVTYDEYMKYCEENAVSQYSKNPGLTIVDKVDDLASKLQNARPIHIGRALDIYSHFGEIELNPYVETEV
jgi:hypothetical protein